jgi:hypothetical protein
MTGPYGSGELPQELNFIFPWQFRELQFRRSGCILLACSLTYAPEKRSQPCHISEVEPSVE